MRPLPRAIGATIITIAAMSGICGDAQALTTAKVSVGSGRTASLHRGPSTQDPLRSLPDGTEVQIFCTLRGESVEGTYGKSDLWDLVLVGEDETGFIADTFVDTGTNEPAEAECDVETLARHFRGRGQRR